jgi:Protein of unknown function (DUF4242)
MATSQREGRLHQQRGVLHIGRRRSDNAPKVGNRMPIYMDRHDLRGTKADDVAEAHRRDVDIQDRYGVKYMAYWFDESNGAAFCLVHAPDPATAELVHREAHGAIPHAIIPVNLAAVEAFLGRISDPRAASGAVAPIVDSGLRAVMFTDIVGSTEMTARLGDSAALELVRVHDALVRRGLEAFGGREIKHTGDGIMASFDKVANSVRAASDIQRRFAAYNADACEAFGSASTRASRSRTITTCSAQRCNSHRGSAAKPRPTESSLPGWCASSARTRIRRGSRRSASGDSRALPKRLRCSGSSGETESVTPRSPSASLHALQPV